MFRYKPSAAAAQRSIDISTEGFSALNISSAYWTLLVRVVIGKSITSVLSAT